jgi:hypothetical protein
VAHLAKADIEDIAQADVVVSFTSPGQGQGGRHVEFGISIALDKQVVLVGPREHVFHALPQVIQFDTTDELIRYFTSD